MVLPVAAMARAAYFLRRDLASPSSSIPLAELRLVLKIADCLAVADGREVLIRCESLRPDEQEIVAAALACAKLDVELWAEDREGV